MIFLRRKILLSSAFFNLYICFWNILRHFRNIYFENYFYFHPISHFTSINQLKLYSFLSTNFDCNSSLTDLRLLQTFKCGMGQSVLPRPLDCPEFLYDMMRHCWLMDPIQRPIFAHLRETLEKIVRNSAMLNEKYNIESVNLSTFKLFFTY